MSKTEKLLAALRSGKELTAKEITAKYGIVNPHDAIYRLRNRAIAVYANQRTLRNGTTVTKYRIGTPTRAMAELGFTQ